jgi:tetratricopeptide (TPR) repeat protein
VDLLGQYDEAFRAAARSALQLAQRRLGATEADRLAAELAQLSIEACRERVASEPRYARPEVFARLVTRYFAQRFREPGLMLDLARKALVVAEGLPIRGEEADAPSLISFDLRSEAWAYVANAHRVRGEFEAAEGCLTEARQWLAKGSGDPLLAARFCSLAANLRAHQRQLEAAEGLFQRAAALYERAGDSHLAGRTLVDLARTFHESGDQSRAISTLYLGASKLDLRRDPSLAIVVIHNLAAYLDAAGYPAHALRLLQGLKTRRASRVAQVALLRARWLEARIAATLGLSPLAAETLQQVCTDMLDLQMPFDAALAALELAVVYTEADKHDEVQRLAEQIYPVFIARAIPREASLALLLFYRSALARTATTEFLGELEGKLKESRKAA